MRSSRKLLAAFLLAGLAGSISAALFTEDFDSLGSGDALDSTVNWTKVNGLSFVGNGSGGLDIGGGAKNVTVVDPSAISYASGQSFSLSYDIELGLGSDNGVIFGYQDVDNYYRWTISKSNTGAGRIDLVRVLAGGNSVAVRESGTEVLEAGKTYRLLVDYAADTDSFSVAVSNLTDSVMDYSDSYVDSSFTSGQFGLYNHYSANDTGDNLTISVVPEAGTVGLFLIGMSGVGLVRKLTR